MAADIYTTFGIDKSKLKRNYLKEPLKITKNGRGSEKPYKEDLNYLYIELNISIKDLHNIFSWSYSTFSRWLKYYNIKKPIFKIEKNITITNLKKYGVPYYSGDITKSKRTRLEKYGDENYNNRGKVKETLFKHYGDENYVNIKKSKETCLKKYGVDSYSKTKEYKNLMSNTKMREHILNKTIETRRKNKTLGKSISSKETKWLDSLGIPNDKRHRQVLLSVNNVQYIVDGFNPETNTVYEFLGDYWHGNPKTQIMENINVQRGVTFQKLYDDTISKLNNLKSKYNVIYIWENDFI